MNFYHGNVKFSACVLFSSNTYRKLFKYFELAGIPWIRKDSYYVIQRKYLFGVANKTWLNQQSTYIDKIIEKGSGCYLSGDGRCDSPGYNAKYCTYSLYDNNISKIIEISLTQVTEAGNSNRMEKYGLIKVLDKMAQKGIALKQITTDRHQSVKEYLREERSDIEHQFDVWHFCKNIKSKILKAAQKKSRKELRSG